MSSELAVSPAVPAYRIHVNRSTVEILCALDEGFQTEVRGRTELKVRPGWKTQLATPGSTEASRSTGPHLSPPESSPPPCLPRARAARKRTGWWADAASTSPSPNRLTCNQGEDPALTRHDRVGPSMPSLLSCPALDPALLLPILPP